MDPMTLALLGGGVQAAGGIVGYLVENGRIEEAMAILDQARNAYGSIEAPDLELAARDLLGPSAVEQIKSDVSLRQAQMSALGRMREMADQGGFTLEDRAALNRIRNESARAATGQQAALMEQFNNRGVGGSGAELALQQSANQAAADRNSQADLDVAGMAQRRAYDAIRDRARMAGDIRGQDWREAMDRANAKDARDKFNATDRLNRKQSDFNNRMDLAGMRYGLEQDRANVSIGQGARSRQFATGMADSVGGAMQGGAGMWERSRQGNNPEYGDDDDDRR